MKRKENRFPKIERLKRQKDIMACLREGKRFYSQLFHLFVRYRIGEGRGVGFSVGRRVAHKATQRNRIRRWIREVYRMNRRTLKEGVDLFIIAQPQCKVANFSEVTNALVNLFKKADLIIEARSSDKTWQQS